jgi:bacterioferritin
VQEIMECDLAAEYDARSLYQDAAAYCETVHDRVTKNLFEDLMADEEGHIDFLETQLELIRQVGLQLYAQRHIGGLGEASEPTEDGVVAAFRSKVRRLVGVPRLRA